jgi:hypothetical protein
MDLPVVVKFCCVRTRGRTMANATIDIITSVSKTSNAVKKSVLHLINKDIFSFSKLDLHTSFFPKILVDHQ